jgi:hypothetical protein
MAHYHLTIHQDPCTSMKQNNVPILYSTATVSLKSAKSTIMDLRETVLGVCGVDSVGSGKGPEVVSCGHGDEPSGSGTM